MGKYKRRETLKTLYTSYEDCPIEIAKEEYIDIVTGFMKFISEKVIAGESVTLPKKTGILRVTGKKMKPKMNEDGFLKGVVTNWKETILLWKRNSEAKKKKKRIYFLNEHTNGIRYKIQWLIGFSTLDNKNIYRFAASRTTSRAIGKEILVNKKEYKIIE